MSFRLLEHIVSSLVDHPNDVTVTVAPRDDKKVVEIVVHPEDLGKIIGREGQTIRALKAVALASHTEHGMLHDVSVRAHAS